MAGYATATDLRNRWQRYPAGLSNEAAEVLLEDASTWLATTFPEIPEIVGGRLANVLRIVVCAMVKRTLIADRADNAEQITDAGGPFSTAMTFRNSEGNFFITSQEREMIEKALNPRTSAFKSVSFGGW